MAVEPCYVGPVRCLSPCCSAPCEPAVPFCHPMRIQYVGEPKLCSILQRQGVDEPMRIELRRKSRYHAANPLTEKLGYPVGVLRSLVASSDKALYFDDKEMNGQRYAMYLKAFALLHILPITDWNRSILDTLMIEGAELYAEQPQEHFRKSIEGAGEGDSPTYTYDETIYSKEESVIKRSFKLKNYEFEIELGEKFTLHPVNSDDPAAIEKATEISLNALKGAMKQYFKTKKYLLLSTNNLYLMVWRSLGMYFVLDFYGRTPNKLELKRDGGFATLLGLRGLDNVYYFISPLTALGKRDTFVLRDLRITMMVDPEGSAQMRAFSTKRAEEFVMITEDYAYLKADFHLSLREKDPLLSRCGLPVSVAAIMASKIDHPASWDEKMMNKIICYGFFVCRCCWEFCQNSLTPIDFNSFPNQLQIGQFAVNVTLIPQVFQGTWYCVAKYQPTELSNSIKEAFEQGFNYLILAINQQNYAIMKKNSFYYLFDPYRHRLPFLNTRSASLRMFGTMAELFRILNLILLESNRTSKFYLHRTIVTDIRVSPTGECHAGPPSNVCPEDLVEVMSINEAICFREDYKRCTADLGQMSEDEEESPFEEDPEFPSEEEPKGEEEGAGELSGFEMSEEDSDMLLRRKRKDKRKKGRRGSSASSGGGGRAGRSKGPKKKGKGDDEGGDKRRKSKSADKGDKKKVKREKAGTTDSEDDGKRKKQGGKRESRRESRRKSRQSLSRRSASRRASKRPSRRSSKRPSKRPSRRPSKRRSRKSVRDDSERDRRGSSKGRRGSKGRGSSKGRDSVKRRESARRRSQRRKSSKSGDSSGRDTDGKGKRKSGKGDGGKGDGGKGEGGKGDGGKGDAGKGDAGKGDAGKGDKGKDDKDRGKDGKGKDDGGKGDKGKDDARRDDTKKGGAGGGGGKSESDSERDRRGRGADGRDGGKGGTGVGREGDKGGRGADDFARRGEKGDRGDGYGDGGRGGKGDDKGRPGGDRGDRYGRGEEGDYRRDRGGPGGDRFSRRDSRDYGSDDGSQRRRDSRFSEDDADLDSEERERRRLRREEGAESGSDKPCKPNAYPGYSCIPYNLTVCGSESGTYESICKLLRAGFKCADRILIMTPWGNFVVFRTNCMLKRMYFLYDGCTCNIERFRHLDLNCGTAGLLCFHNLHRVITYMIDTRRARTCLGRSRQQVIEQICNTYCKPSKPCVAPA